MRIAHRSSALLLLSLLGVASCEGGEGGPPLFTLLPPERTGITFANAIVTSDSQNVQYDSFVYNGGGVAIGDVDNDGLADVYLTGNMVSSRLYLNKGDMRFEDITESAGVGTNVWAYGASMVDIDGDGYLDI
ncbi:MAG: VCBS repeat-containing protein, partial [Gemmatimonadales bacterium]